MHIDIYSSPLATHITIQLNYCYLILTWNDLGLLTSKPPDQVQLGTSISLTQRSWS